MREFPMTADRQIRRASQVSGVVTAVKSACVLMVFAFGTNVADVHAKIVVRAPGHFTLKGEVTIQASPQATYQAMVKEVDRWWRPDHTYTGDSKNLYIEEKPQGVFGERFPEGGGTRHMTVIHARVGRLLRMEGGLGPLQEHAVQGVLSFELKPAKGAKGVESTVMTWTYHVQGYVPGATGLELWAGPVDFVLNQQVQSLKKYAESKAPTTAEKPR